MGRAECEAWAREPIAPAQDGFGATQDSAHPDEIHLHIYGEYKYGMGLLVVVITNATGLLKHWNRVPTERVDESATPTVEENDR